MVMNSETITVPQVLCSGTIEAEYNDACKQNYVNFEVDFPGNDAPDDVVPILSCQGAGGMVLYVNGSDPNHFKAWFEVNGGTEMDPDIRAVVRYMLLSCKCSKTNIKEPVVRAFLSRRE